MFKGLARRFDRTALPTLISVNFKERYVIFGEGDTWLCGREVTQSSMNRLLNLLFTSTQFRYTHSVGDEACFEEFKPRW